MQEENHESVTSSIFDIKFQFNNLWITYMQITQKVLTIVCCPLITKNLFFYQSCTKLDKLRSRRSITLKSCANCYSELCFTFPLFFLFLIFGLDVSSVSLKKEYPSTLLWGHIPYNVIQRVTINIVGICIASHTRHKHEQQHSSRAHLLWHQTWQDQGKTATDTTQDSCYKRRA